MMKAKGTSKRPYFGTPAKSMGSRDFGNKFGHNNTVAGAMGERIFFDLMNSQGGWLPDGVPLFCSLIPSSKYNSDVDFAICIGKKILLIDVKMYRNVGGFWWSAGKDKRIYRNLFTPLKSSSGKNVTMSRSMSMARNVISQRLPGYSVESIVIIVNSRKARTVKEPITWFLKAPGGVKVFNESSAKRYISKFFKWQKRIPETETAERFLASLCQ